MARLTGLLLLAPITGCGRAPDDFGPDVAQEGAGGAPRADGGDPASQSDVGGGSGSTASDPTNPVTAADAAAPEPEPNAPPPDLAHTFAALSVAPTSEDEGSCQSWTIGNEEPLWVHRIVASNQGGLHHSNWIWVPDSMYAGEDGTWRCGDRGFDQILAGALGGVFFAQSTQSLTDEQAFPEGAAFLVPAHARIIGDIHTLNPGATEIPTSVHFDIYTLPEAEVTIPLQPMAFTNLALDIAPRTETHARMQCQVPQPDFDVYYVLPHFHELGTRLRIDVAGGPLDGAEIFRSSRNYGDPLGETFDPPIAVTGALGLGITCEFVNPRDATVGYGIGDQEMCVVLIYSTGKKAGGTTLGNLSTSDSGSVHRTDALCVAIAAP